MNSGRKGNQRRDGKWYFEVSIYFLGCCSYMKAAQVGEEIVIDAKTLRAGRTLAFLTVDITRKSDGALLAQGKHTKFVGDV